jgi:hypothetical protein
VILLCRLRVISSGERREKASRTLYQTIPQPATRLFLVHTPLLPISDPCYLYSDLSPCLPARKEAARCRLKLNTTAASRCLTQASSRALMRSRSRNCWRISCTHRRDRRPQATACRRTAASSRRPTQLGKASMRANVMQ